MFFINLKINRSHLFCGYVVHCLLVTSSTKGTERKVTRCHMVKGHLGWDEIDMNNIHCLRAIHAMLLLSIQKTWKLDPPQYSRGRQLPQMFFPQVSSAQPSRTYLKRAWFSSLQHLLLVMISIPFKDSTHLDAGTPQCHTKKQTAGRLEVPAQLQSRSACKRSYRRPWWTSWCCQALDLDGPGCCPWEPEKFNFQSSWFSSYLRWFIPADRWERTSRNSS